MGGEGGRTHTDSTGKRPLYIVKIQVVSGAGTPKSLKSSPPALRAGQCEDRQGVIDPQPLCESHDPALACWWETNTTRLVF